MKSDAPSRSEPDQLQGPERPSEPDPMVHRARPLQVALLAGFMMLITALLSGSILYRLSLNALREEVRGNLIRTARAASAVIDGNAHRAFVSRAQEASPEYKEAIAPLENIRKAAGDIRFVYTCVMISNRVFFVLDPTPEGDADHDGVDDKSHIMQPYEDASAELVAALNSGQAGANEEPYRDAWGMFVSGFAPFHDSHGRFVGVVAVDLNASAYAERLAGMRMAAWAGAGIALLLSFLAGAAIFRLQRNLEDYRHRIQKLNADLELRVAERTAQLKASKEKLEEEVIERRRAEAEANLAKEVAEGASRAKSEFFGAMSHELRTPMNGIIGSAYGLESTPLDDEQRDWITNIKTAGESLLGMISDILEYSQRESDKLTIQTTLFEVREVIRSAVQLHSVQAREKAIELTAHICDEVPQHMAGDPGRVRQVLVHLVGNSLKFTEKGQVKISARLKKTSPKEDGWCQTSSGAGGFIEISVTDTGVGIPSSHHSRVFQEFMQVDASTGRKHGGAGLGLALCKRLVEMMGGKIAFDSEAGRGAKFWFTVPVKDVGNLPDCPHRGLAAAAETRLAP